MSKPPLRRLVHSRFLPRRFVVADRSMEPTLVDGQGLIAIGVGRARVGQLRCVQHPQRPGFWLVKRVAEVHDVNGAAGEDGAAGTNGDAGATMTVLSDNRDSTRADSRTFGPVPVAGSYRVVIRIPRRWM